MRSDMIKKGIDRAPHRTYYMQPGSKRVILKNRLSAFVTRSLKLSQDTNTLIISVRL